MASREAAESTTARAASASRRVLFLTDNGHGLGHVTRLLAIARRCPDGVQPVFLTMSTSHRLIAQAGFPVEYFPSPDRWGLRGDAWSALLSTKLTSAVARLRPAALVVDHVRPAAAMDVLRERFPDLALVWCRRGLWRRGRNADALDRQPAFDLVLEPLDLAAPVDAGLTPVSLERVVHVPPITFLDRDELLPRDEARAALGLDRDRPAALVNLNADDSDELAAHIRRAAAVLRGRDGIQVVAPDHALHAGRLHVDDRVVVRAVYPLSRYLAAFDLGVITPGYNSYHEVVMAGLPCVFVPRRTSTVDDQERRASFAELGGFGWFAPSLEDPAFEAAVTAARDPLARRRVQAAMAAVHPGNGAGEAARTIAALSRRSAGDGAPSDRPSPPLPASGGGTRPDRGGRERVMIGAPFADEAGLRAAVRRSQATAPDRTEPVLLIPPSLAPWAQAEDLLHETLLPEDVWAALEPEESYEQYVRARWHELRAVCSPDRELSIGHEEP